MKMKKDKIIEEQLNKLVQDIQPISHRLLAPAKIEMINRAKQIKKKPRLIIGLAAVFAMVMFLVIFGVLSYFKDNQKPDNGNLQSYYINSLSIQSSTTKIDDERILSFDYDKMSASYNSYYSSDELVMYGTKYRVVTDKGTDIILVYSDLKRGLKDYRDIKKAKQYTISKDILINQYEKYENGEFYTYAFYSDEKADYYIFIISPNYGLGIKYIENLLK